MALVLYIHLLFSSLIPLTGYNPLTTTVAVGDTTNMCLDEAFHAIDNGPINCTANDVTLTSPTITVIDGCDYVGDTATINIVGDFEASRSEAYDIGIRMGNDISGLPTYPGSCFATNLPASISFDGDTCGDLLKGTTSDIDVGTFTVQCVDPDGNGQLDIDYIITWRSNDYACHTASQAVMNNPAKCNFDGGIDIPVYVPAPQADFSVIKDAPVSAYSGDTIAYTITITNNGPSAATGTLTDTLPEGFTYISASAGNLIGNTLNYNVFLLSGATETVIVTGIVTGTSGAIVSNTASVTSSITDTNTTNNTDNATTTILFSSPYVPSADLSLTKAGFTTAVSGASVSYTITITNNGPDAATSTLTDTLPEGFTCTSTSDEAVACAPTITRSIYLLNGASYTLTVNGTVIGTSGTSISNTASVTSNIADPNTDDNTDTTVGTITKTYVPSADLSLTKAGFTTAVSGASVSYTITITNNGPDAATGTLTDTLPEGFTCTSTSDEAVACAPTITRSIYLLNGASYTLTVNGTVIGTSGTSISNTASVTSNIADPNTDDNTDTTVGTITEQTSSTPSNPTPTIDLLVKKVVDKSIVGPGDTLTYVITVTNNGSSIAHGVFVADILSSNVSIISAPGYTGTGFMLGNINPSTTSQITIQVRVNSGFVGTITNTAGVSMTDSGSVSSPSSVSTVVSIQNIVSTNGGGSYTNTNYPTSSSTKEIINPVVAVLEQEPNIIEAPLYESQSKGKTILTPYKTLPKKVTKSGADGDSKESDTIEDLSF